MSMDTTSIMDLPTDPTGGGRSNNISLNASENTVVQPAAVSLDQTTINQIVNSLQQASISGATQLSSRDIPMTTNNISTDQQVLPNYVPMPPPNHIDYIKDHDGPHNMIENYDKNVQRQTSLDDMYNEIQIPLLLSVLYFLFQLPFFRKFLFTYFPVLFSNDGNLNINGFLFMSTLFGLIFYVLNIIIKRFNTFNTF